MNKEGKILWKYVSKESRCAACKLAGQCLPEKTPYRQLYRWEHEAVIDAHKQRMKEHGREPMRIRSSLAEHPFGTMKCEMGWRHFLLRGLEKVRGEMSLQMLSYNFKRALNVLGIVAFKNRLSQRVLAC